jgi:hypothetical protein
MSNDTSNSGGTNERAGPGALEPRAIRPPWLAEPVPHSRGRLLGLDVGATSKADYVLLVVAILSALSSIGALLLHAADFIDMPYTVTFVSLPGTLLLISLTVWTGRTSRELFFNRLTVGFAVGAVGVVIYDAIRWVVQETLPIGFDAFYSIVAFGNLITGAPATSGTAVVVGWAYHISNGLTFGVLYSLIAGPARWWYGLIWGLILEIAMLVVYPPLFQMGTTTGFVLVSIVGHAAFGAVIGLGCRRWALPAGQ